MLQVNNLSKEFQSGDSLVKAVNNITFSVESGTMAAIVGKSGSGKSTLLALLGALDVPSSGTIMVEGRSLTGLTGRELLSYRRSTIGFVFQQYHLVPNLSAIQNVMLPAEFVGTSREHRKSRAEYLLKEVGLTGGKVHRLPGKLSGGEQQRVAIARALINTPRLVLADEPTGNLDSQTGKIIIQLLRSLAESEKTTVITVTHDQSIASSADRVFKLADGTLQ